MILTVTALSLALLRAPSYTAPQNPEPLQKWVIRTEPAATVNAMSWAPTGQESVTAEFYISQHASARREDFVFQQIDRLAELMPGWSGEGAVAPHDRTISAAKALIGLMPPDWPLPQVAASAEGEIELIWVTESNRIEAIFDAEGLFTSFGRVGSRYIAGDELTWNDSLPQGLVSLMDQRTA